MSRVAELTTVLEKKLGQINEFTKNGIKIDGENVEVKSEDAAAIRKLFAEAKEIKELIQMEQFGVDTKSWIDGDAGSEAMKNQATAAKMYRGPRTLGAMFTDSDQFKSMMERKEHKSDAFELGQYDITLGVKQMAHGQPGMQFKDVYAAQDSQVITTGVGTVIQFDPLVPRGHRPTRVRDLFPVAATASNLIEFFKVMGWVENSGDGNAGMVPDRDSNESNGFGRKPKSNLKFSPDAAPVRTIAHWEAAHRNVINDVPQLQATINNELLYGLALKEDEQLLNGDGTGENIKGILKTEGIQIYTAPANELRSDSLRKASTIAMLANYPANGYVVHPNDWEQIELQKGNTGTSGDGQYMLFTNIAIGVNAQVWRQPVVETPAISQGTFLNGAFGAGAQVYDRQQASIRIADQHAEMFVQNAIAILCEERIALAVKRPEAFVRGAFA